MRPLPLSDAEAAELAAFLESLTGSDVETLVADAFAAPVGDATDGAGPGRRLSGIATADEHADVER